MNIFLSSGLPAETNREFNLKADLTMLASISVGQISVLEGSRAAQMKYCMRVLHLL